MSTFLHIALGYAIYFVAVIVFASAYIALRIWQDRRRTAKRAKAAQRAGLPSQSPHTVTPPTSLPQLGFRELRSLAAQYFAAYVDDDQTRMAAISSTVPPQQLLDGMVYVAHTHACVAAFHEDGDVARVAQRDCDSAIAVLTNEDNVFGPEHA